MPLPCCSTLQAASTAQAVPILFVFLSRGLPLERAAACVCREAARPPLLANVLDRDFNIHPKMWRSRHRNRALFFHTIFCRRPKLCDPSAGPQPGRLRTTVSRACGLHGARGGSWGNLRGCRSAEHWLRGKERRLAAKAQATTKDSKSDQPKAKAETLGPELESDDDQLGSDRLSERRVGAFLVLARECKCSAGSATGSSAPGTGRGPKGHQCSVNCKLRATPKCKSVSNDVDAALILPGDNNVEITKPSVEGNGGSAASRQVRAAARSRGPPLARRTPDRGHVARWPPKRSCNCRQRQRAEVKGRGRRSRRRNNTEERRAEGQLRCRNAVASYKAATSRAWGSGPRPSKERMRA